MSDEQTDKIVKGPAFSPAFAAGYLIGLVFPIRDQNGIVSRISCQRQEYPLPQVSPAHER